MDILNLGVLAHVDAGKTSLTERLLLEAGAISVLGRVDAGTTRTDSMDIERRRGITVRSNVASFVSRGVQANLVDTPGHSDFIAEVERSLAVLDAAILVVSAVEGVQPQTVVLWRALRRLAVPTLVFVNKIDRGGADPERAADEVERRLVRPGGVLRLARAVGPGIADASVHEVAITDAHNVETLADRDDTLLAEVVDGGRLHAGQLRAIARDQIRRAELVPLTVGSAITGAGVDVLLAAVTRLLPRARSAATAPSAVVFKIDRDGTGKVVHARVFSGPLWVRDRVATGGPTPERITSLRASRADGLAEVAQARTGDVVAIRGLTRARVGDWLGPAVANRVARQFPPPALEAVVDPVDPRQRGVLFAALAALAEQDPLIDLRVDNDRGELAISLYGDVQREVVAALLAEQFGVAASFRETTTVHIERIVGTGAAHAIMSEKTTPYLATVGLRVEAGEVGTGLRFGLEVELGSMPPAFFTATESGVRSALAQGRFGWAIPDARVTMTHCGYAPRQSAMHQKFNKAISSVAADFRNLAPVIVHEALRQAGTVVCEPVEAFVLEIPVAALNSVTRALAHAEGTVTDSDATDRYLTLRGHIPTRRVREFGVALRDLARGEGVLTSEPDRYDPVTGRPPRRPRAGVDPIDRELWFRAHPR